MPVPVMKRIDLDDIGSKVTEQLGAVGARDSETKIQDPDSFKGAFREVCFPLERTGA